MVKHIGSGERGGFDILVNVIHQQNGWRAFIMWRFSRLEFCLSRLKITMLIKDTNGKKKFKRMLSFLSVDKPELFAMKLSFKEFTLVFFTADRSAWLVLNQQGSEVNAFLKTLEVHSVLYHQRKVRF